MWGFDMYFFTLALAVGIIAGLIGPSLIVGSVATVATLLIAYFSLPTLALSFADGWVIAIPVLTASCAMTIALGKSSKRTIRVVDTFAVAVVLWCGASFVTTTTMLNATAYSGLLGDVKTVPFSQAMQRLDLSGKAVSDDATVIDQTNVRLIDSVIAERMAEQVVGSDPALGGTYVLGDMQLTRLHGVLVWAAPLDFSGWSAWRSTDASPAYVWVNAHTGETKLVREVNGQPIAMKCLESSYFGSYADRIVWSSGHQSVGLEDYSFELDSAGNPQYVVTVYANRVGLSGADPTGIVVLDPQTCTTRDYTMTNIPAWVNRVVPDDIAQSQATRYGDYHLHGWWNAHFGAGADILTPSGDIELVTTSKNGDTAWYQGMSTPGNPNGTTGFLLIDSRTKRATYFEQDGATEDAAQVAILGKISEKRGYTTTSPILYNIGGRATYLVTLKDAGGNPKGVGLMPVDNRNIVIVADDLRRGLLMYEQAIASSSYGTGGVGGGEPIVTLDGKVYRFSSEVVDGNTVYYIVLADHPGIILSANSGISPQVALTRAGDTIHVQANPDIGSGTLSVQSLTNPAAAAALVAPATPPSTP
jgi:hypothetical protein